MPHRRTSLAILFAAAMLLPAAPCRAYPISPVTLWELVERADLIVVADVTALEPLPEPDYDTAAFDADTVARLAVRETWKGPAQARVDVPFIQGLICPAPPRYIEGERVVAFLAADGDDWRTVTLSYGTLYLRADDLPVMRDRVREAVELQARERLEVRDHAAWLVRVASHPATRWHGLYELMPESDRLHAHYDREGSRGRVVLNAEELGQVAKAFVADPAIDRTFPMVLALLRHYADPDVDRVAIGAVDALVAQDEPPWWTRDALTLLLARLGDRDPEARLAPLGEPWSELDPRLLRRIWAETRRELHLPDLAPVELREPEVWGVGPDTPS